MSVFSYVIADESRSFRCIAEFIQARLGDDSRVEALRKAKHAISSTAKKHPRDDYADHPEDAFYSCSSVADFSFSSFTLTTGMKELAILPFPLSLT